MLEGAVGISDFKLLICDQNGLVTVLEYFGCELQLLLNAAGLGDIPADTQKPLKFVFVVPQPAGL